ncbi:hypothetical protein Tco_0038840 [Tanacetum coccineum]
MANLSEDIQCAGSDTRPPMLDRTDFASWQQRIRLYCRGPERARVYSDLSPEDKDRYNADIRATNILLQGLPKDIYTLINHYTEAKDIWDNVKMLLEAVKLNRGLRDSNYDQLYAYLKQHEAHANENKMILDRFTQHVNRGQGNNSQGAGAAGYGGAQNRVGNANLGGQDHFDDCDAFDSDVDEAPTAQTMFMENLSSADPVYDQASSSYDSDILSEYQDMTTIGCYLNQYVKDNAVPVVQSNVSSVPNDAYMMMFNDIYEQSAKCVFVTTLNNVSDNSLTAELATSKEQVELYERRAKFELIEREQKIDEQLRIVITDCNRKEESLKRELHSVKLQLTSTINHNKSMVEEVTSLKKDFKQKENKYLEEFLDMKALKEKVEDKLYKQDQSLQTVHVLCKPNPYYDDLNKVAIRYKNPLCLTHAQQLQPALYNGHEIIKTNHVPAIVHNSEDTLEIAEITRKKMNDKMKDPECVKKKSNDLIKMKAEALKEQTIASRPIKALTVYPPNTPATLVPGVLPTKS